MLGLQWILKPYSGHIYKKKEVGREVVFKVVYKNQDVHLSNFKGIEE